MKTAVVLVVVACCAVSALSLAEGVKESKPPATVSPAQQFGDSTPDPPKPTTKPTTPTTKPTTKPTIPTTKPTTPTTKPTTPTPKPTTTTPKPTTTTPKPTTTTPKPTTTTPKPTTTTPKPTTTTPKPTTTTPKPTTKPPPTPGPTPSTNLTVGNYNITNAKKEVCLRADMALQIRLESPEANGTFIVQPDLTTASGSCMETKSALILTFKEGTITFGFNKSVANNSAYVDSLSFNLTYAFVKGASKSYFASNTSLHLFATKIGHSYSCKSEALYMGKGLYLDVDQDRMQGFNLTKSGDFGSSDVCAADKPDYRVAIGVGVTLLVLIVIVVIAYMVSRKRRTDGYQTL